MTLRILYVSANGFPRSQNDARGTFSLEHVKALQDEGAAVTAVDMQAPGLGEDSVDEVRIRRIPRLRPILRSLSRKRLSAYVNAWRELRRTEYDCLIFSFFYLKYLPFIRLLAKPGVTVLFIVHGGEVMPAGPIRRMLKRYMFRRTDLVTPVSDYTATLLSCLVNRRNADNRKFALIYNGIDGAKLRPRRGVGELRAELGIPDDDFVVLSICNLVKRKGIDILVLAIAKLLSEGRKIHHVIIGSGPEEAALKRLSAEDGHADRFHFLSNVNSNDLADYYAMADVFAMVSVTDWDNGQTEGFGITYAESMAVGTPVIGGGESGTTTPVKHGFTGMLVDPHSPTVAADVTAVIRGFMDDREQLKEMSENAKWFARNHLTWQANAKATIRAIERVRRGS